MVIFDYVEVARRFFGTYFFIFLSLQIYNDTHKKLDAFNKYSKARYLEVHNHFEIHTKLLKEVKSDLDGVFLKLRKIKTHLSLKYPNEMQTVLEKNPPPVVEDD